MNDPILTLTSVLAVVFHTLGGNRSHSAHTASEVDGDDLTARDRGAVSIEQVLWYAAAAVSVAVVAAIIWGQIRDTASTPVQAPTAP